MHRTAKVAIELPGIFTRENEKVGKEKKYDLQSLKHIKSIKNVENYGSSPFPFTFARYYYNTLSH
jgi:hypothetical protein